jgi:TIR domain
MLDIEWLTKSLDAIAGTVGVAICSRCLRRALRATAHLSPIQVQPLLAIAEATAKMAAGSEIPNYSEMWQGAANLKNIKSTDVGTIVASVAIAASEAWLSCYNIFNMQRSPMVTSGQYGLIVNVATSNHHVAMKWATRDAVLRSLKAIESASATMSLQNGEYAQLAIWHATAADVIAGKSFYERYVTSSGNYLIKSHASEVGPLGSLWHDVAPVFNPGQLPLIEYYSYFISYSANDQEFDDKLYDDLFKNGVRCWLSTHDIQGGEKIHEQIDDAIRVYDRLLLILSKDSINSEWLRRRY